MSVIGRRSPRYGDIRRLRNLASDYYAVTGDRKTVIKAELVSDVLLETSEWSVPAPSLDADLYLAGGDRYLYVLHEDGLTRIDENGVLPDVTDVFDVGGKWVVVGQDTVLAPEGRGVRVYSDLALGSSKLVAPARMSQATEAVLDSVNSLLYVADQISAKIHVFRDVGTVLSYIDSFPARNCRDIVKLELDSVNDKLFVVCKHRIVSFSVPNDGVEDDAVSVALHEDYGVSRVTYTDFQVLPAGYWIGSDSDNAMYPNARFLGRVFAVFSPAESDNGVLVAAYPDVSQFAVSDVIPYVEDVADLPEIEEVTVPSEPPTLPPAPPAPPTPPAPPPVIAPDPPVITSALESNLFVGIPWTYTITATGVGPITFDVVNPPAWLTSINHVTGVIGGTPPDSQDYPIQLRATNAGGSDNETLLATGLLDVASLSAVTVNGVVTVVRAEGPLVYIAGYFTSVSDASGAKARDGGACLNLETGLWTAWNPAPKGAGICSDMSIDANHVYLVGSFTTVNGVAQSRFARVNKTTGARDTSWLPVAGASPTCIDASSGTVYVGGPFTSLQGDTSIRYVGALSKASGAAATKYDPEYPGPGDVAGSLASAIEGILPSSYGPVMFGGAIGTSEAGYTYRSLGVHLVRGGTWEQCVAGQVIQTGTGYCLNPSGTVAYQAMNSVNVVEQPVGVFVPRTRAYSVTLPLRALTAWDPAPSSAPDCLAYDPIFDGVFLGGDFANIGGDTARRSLGKVTSSSGAIVSAFQVTFSDASVTVESAACASGFLAIGGDWTGNINGTAKSYFAVLNSQTGALY